ncbi:hypothetical protein Baya_1652 [Bagarius yarrelli]|uniref:RING-type domain-containing protein n=1 Tax=Bagarius yarrelli TaxID=175774 RepID=A0A556TLR3_BAGYA|nr:hypothetical protein Baya_1652 [Bagarius yarrelli]
MKRRVYSEILLLQLFLPSALARFILMPYFCWDHKCFCLISCSKTFNIPQIASMTNNLIWSLKTCSTSRSPSRQNPEHGRNSLDKQVLQERHMISRIQECAFFQLETKTCIVFHKTPEGSSEGSSQGHAVECVRQNSQQSGLRLFMKCLRGGFVERRNTSRSATKPGSSQSSSVESSSLTGSLSPGSDLQRHCQCCISYAARLRRLSCGHLYCEPCTVRIVNMAFEDIEGLADYPCPVCRSLSHLSGFDYSPMGSQRCLIEDRDEQQD